MFDKKVTKLGGNAKSEAELLAEIEALKSDLAQAQDQIELLRKPANRGESSASAVTTVLDASPFGITVASVARRQRVYANNAALDLYGATNKDQFLAVPLVESYANPQDFHDITAEIVGNERSFDHEVERRRMDGSKWWCRIVSREISFLGEDCIFSLHYDVSEKRQRERELRIAERDAAAIAGRHQAEAQFRQLIEESYDITIVGDLDSIIEYESPATMRIFGYEAGENIGKAALGLVHPDDLAAVSTGLDKLISGRAKNLQLEYRRQHKLGHWVTMQSNLRLAVLDGEQKVVVNARDISDWKSAELELRQSQTLLTAIVENAQVSIFVKDRDGRYILANRKFREWSGNETNRVIGKTIADLAPEYAETWKVLDGELMASGDAADKVFYYMDEAGKMRPVLTSRFTIPDVDGQAVAIGGVGIDLTDYRQAEEAWRASEARFKDFAESSTDWLWELDADYRFTSLIGYEEATGLEAADAIGNRREELRGGRGSTDETWRSYRASLDAREVLRDFEYRYRGSDGQTRYARINGKPVFNDEGEFTGYRGVGRDITERREADLRAEAAVRASEQRLRETIDSLPVAFQLWGPDERLVMTNQTQLDWFPEIADKMVPGLRLEDFFQYAAENNLVEMTDGGEAEFVRSRLAAYRSIDTQVEQIQLVGGRWLQARTKRLPDGSVIGVRLDATDLMRREEQLIQVQKMEAIGQLTSGLAHDFNNILGIVVGHLEVVKRRLPIDGVITDSIDAAMLGANRGIDLTRQMLGFASQKPLMMYSVDVNQSIGSIWPLLERALTRVVNIQTDLAEVIWPVRIDRSDFENALLNLVLNGRDAMPEGGMLTVSSENRTVVAADPVSHSDVVPGDYVVVSVRDSGHGIDDEIREKIFEPFFTTKSEAQGTGLGLSMVYGFVQRSGGNIHLQSSPELGSVFTIYLPRADGRSIDLEKFKDDAGLLVGGSETILVVDDEELLRRVATTHLRDLGYQVLEAANGVEALDLLYDYPTIALMFCDVVMPGGIDGYELARRAIAERPDLKVLFTTGYSGDQRPLDADGRPIGELPGLCLNKPYVMSGLAHSVRMSLGPTIIKTE